MLADLYFYSAESLRWYLDISDSWISYKIFNYKISKLKFPSCKIPKLQNANVTKFPVTTFPSYKRFKLQNSQIKKFQSYEIVQVMRFLSYDIPELHTKFQGAQPRPFPLVTAPQARVVRKSGSCCYESSKTPLL